MAAVQMRAVGRALVRSARAAPSARSGVPRGFVARHLSAAAAPTSVHIASNLPNPHDAEDLVITYGGTNAAIPATVRPIAVVKVGGEVITKEPENLVASLKFLRDCGLQPVVVHGGGPQLNDELAKAGVVPEYIGGASRDSSAASGRGARHTVPAGTDRPRVPTAKYFAPPQPVRLLQSIVNCACRAPRDDPLHDGRRQAGVRVCKR